MGVNLPARLVVIKSTICYRGAERGYEEYSRAEIEQIVGRAGRVQYETQGIAVIMTTINNIQKY
jgi:ATP-dependent DNA helicase HFM1/MER3